MSELFLGAQLSSANFVRQIPRIFQFIGTSEIETREAPMRTRLRGTKRLSTCECGSGDAKTAGPWSCAALFAHRRSASLSCAATSLVPEERVPASLEWFSGKKPLIRRIPDPEAQGVQDKV